MKKFYVLLLALFVVSSVALVAIACGEAEETATTAAADETTVVEDVTTTEAASTALTPAEAKAMGDALLASYEAAGSPEDKSTFVTEEITVAGPVFSVKDKGTFAIVAIGDDANPFNILVPYEVFEAAGLTLDGLNAWMGTEIEVTGTIVVNEWGSLTEMQISDMAQIALPQ